MQTDSWVDQTDALCSIYCALHESKGSGSEVQGNACRIGDSWLEKYMASGVHTSGSGSEAGLKISCSQETSQQF